VSYPIKFYGHVSTHTEEGRQVRGGTGYGCVDVRIMLQPLQRRLRQVAESDRTAKAYAMSVIAVCLP
jgi:hypothetical protein